MKVWFDAGGKTSKAFTYTLASDDAADVLILAVENYTGGSPAYADNTGPNYLADYTSALDALGVTYDVYDTDARGLRAPDPLGVLSHYKAVVWYTGDDYVTREPGQPGGTGAHKLAQDVQMAVRDYLNEGGKLLLTGSMSGEQYFDAFDYPQFGGPVPTPSGFCDNVDQTVADTCIPLSNDFFQYWLGGYIYAAGTGVDGDGNVFDAIGTGDPFTGAAYAFLQGDDGNQDDVNGAGSALVTSSILKPDEFPQFAWPA